METTSSHPDKIRQRDGNWIRRDLLDVRMLQWISSHKSEPIPLRRDRAGFLVYYAWIPDDMDDHTWHYLWMPAGAPNIDG